MSDQLILCGLKKKTIKNIIRKKIDEWLESIDNMTLRQNLKQKTVVTGGCIVSMLLGEKINDFDIYLRDHDTTLAVAKYYLEKFNLHGALNTCATPKIMDIDGRIKIVIQSAGVAESETPVHAITDPIEIEDTYHETEEKALQTKGEKNKYHPIFLTTNAITLSDRLQIIVRFYGEPDEIHTNYDYAHCTNYWTSWNNELVLRTEALEAILSRNLLYVGSKYPICSLVRMRKFIQRGWRINAGQILKIAMQISKLNLENIDVLEDQLTGVDTAYFAQLISQLREKDPEKVDAAYLVEIIDRIF